MTTQKTKTNPIQITAQKLESELSKLEKEIESVRKQRQILEASYQENLTKIGGKVAEIAESYIPSGLGINYSEDFSIELNNQIITNILQEMFKISS